jgi:hypothetical protein
LQAERYLPFRVRLTTYFTVSSPYGEPDSSGAPGNSDGEKPEMTIHKTISEKVLKANRENAKRSTGPKQLAGKLAVRNNAVKHGLLATKIICRNEEEHAAFHALLDELEDDYSPSGALERMLLEEIGVSWWKLGGALSWERRFHVAV